MNYQEIIQQLELAEPPSDWLTRAITLSGAAEGSDWAGLLEHVSRLACRHKVMCDGESELKQRIKATSSNYAGARLLAERHAGMLARIYDELDADAELADAGDSDELDGEVRKLRERAESAEKEANDWKKSHDVAEQRRVAFESDSNSLHIERNKLRERAEHAESERTRLGCEYTDEIAKSHLKCLEWRERAEAAEMALETKSDELGAMLSNAKQKVKVPRYRIKELESELETSNGYRTGISNDLDQTQMQSNEFSRELNDVAGLLDERPARGVLVGPGIEDGVAHIVNKRLNRDLARIKELRERAEADGAKARELDRVQEILDSMGEHPAVMHERVGSWIDRAVKSEEELAEFKSAATPTPTQTDLSRIAAALEKIANNG